MENGQMSRSTATPHSSGNIQRGALFSSSRAASTASTSQLALMLRFTTFKKTSVMARLLPELLDHVLHLVKLSVAHAAGPGKRCNKRRQ